MTKHLQSTIASITYQTIVWIMYFLSIYVYTLIYTNIWILLVPLISSLFHLLFITKSHIFEDNLIKPYFFAFFMHCIFNFIYFLIAYVFFNLYWLNQSTMFWDETQIVLILYPLVNIGFVTITFIISFIIKSYKH